MTGGLLVVVLVAVLPLLVAALLLVTAAPATATSCAAVVGDAPSSIAATGTYDIGMDTQLQFRDAYTGVVMGTVREVRSPGEVGPVDLVVEVTASLGPDVGTTAIITQSDTGEMMGHIVTVGQHYFIPYATPEGVPSAFVCDPMVAIPVERAQALVDAAQEGAWPGEARMADQSDDPAQGEARESDVPGVIGVSGVPGADVLATAAVLGATLAAAGATLLLLRRRHGGRAQTARSTAGA